MRFQIPQFIEVEDKIFGPFTFKQFIYMAGGLGMVAIFFTFLPKFIAIILAIPVIILSAALTFYKVNNRPFINAMEAYIKYLFTKKLFIWKMSARGNKDNKGTQPTENRHVVIPKVSQSKLKDLTWDLSVRGAPKQDSNNNEESV